MTRPIRTNRRRVLLALGAGVGGVLAGCTDDGGKPTYETGEVGTASGEERSSEEMAVAESLAQREVNETVTPLDALEFRTHEFVVEDGYQGATVRGVLENTGDARVDVVEIRVRVYDEEGNQLGRYLASTGDLDAGRTWSFGVIVLESPRDVAGYDIAALGTPA